MSAKRKIIFLCNLISEPEKEVFHYVDSSQRTNASYKKILEENGVEVVLLDLSVPKKTFFQRRYRLFQNKIPSLLYYTLRLIFFWKRLFHYMAYMIKDRQHYNAILTYSYHIPNVFLCCFAYYLLNKRIVLDYEDGLFLHKTRALYYTALEKIILHVSGGCIVRNNELKKRLPPGMPSEVILGVIIPQKGVNLNVSSNRKGRIQLLYSGLLVFERGLGHLFDIFSSPNAQEIDFHIAGRGMAKEGFFKFVPDTPSHDNIHFHGYLPLEDLTRLEQNIDGLLLFQNEDSPIYETNFPSKLFHYLSFGKPVFFNRCSLFAQFEHFANAFAIKDIGHGADEILEFMGTQERSFPEAFPQMKTYNAECARKFKRMLFGDAK